MACFKLSQSKKKGGANIMKWYQNKKIIVGIVAVIVVCLGIVYAVTSQPSIVVKAQEIELGDTVALTKESLLDTEKMDAELVNDIKITSDLMTDTDKYSYNEETGEVTSKDENYLEAGTYTVTLTYGDKTEEAEIKVQDTKAPEFIGFRDTITVEQNAEGFDLSRYFLAEDKSEVSVEPKEKTDISKAETITNTIVATDEFDNSTEKECEIKVVTQEDIKNGTKLTPMIDGNVPVSKDTLEKAESGDIDVQVEDVNEELSTAYKDIQDENFEGKHSFSALENNETYYYLGKYDKKRDDTNPHSNESSEEASQTIENEDTSNSTSNVTQSSDANAGNHSTQAPSQPTNNNSGGTSSPSQPSQPTTQPQQPACDDTIPAGFWADRAAAEAYAQQVVMDALLSGQASHGGYYVDIYRTGCGTKYYGITFK